MCTVISTCQRGGSIGTARCFHTRSEVWCVFHLPHISLWAFQTLVSCAVAEGQPPALRGPVWLDGPGGPPPAPRPQGRGPVLLCHVPPCDMPRPYTHSGLGRRDRICAPLACLQKFWPQGPKPLPGQRPVFLGLNVLSAEINVSSPLLWRPGRRRERASRASVGWASPQSFTGP